MNVTHFDPYFYVPCPRGFDRDDLEPFKNHLNVRTCNPLPILTLKYLCRKFQGVIMLYEQNSSRKKAFGAIRGIRLWLSSRSSQMMREISPKFEISASRALRAAPPYFPPRVFERAQCTYQELFGAVIPTFESNIVYTLRFMIDTKVVGMNWIEVPAGNYTLVPAKKSKCQIEISVRFVSPRNATSARIQWRIDGTSSFPIRRKANGPRLRLCEFLVLISNARAGRASSQKQTRIRSSKSPIW